MSEQTEATEATAVEETTEPAGEAVAEAPAVEDAVAEEPQAEAPAAGEPVAEEAPALPGRREALVYLCERGHRTLVLWGEPPAQCNARIARTTLCGRPIYHMTELPEQVQKALNPLKASKKKAGKK
jgi:hypothetical protein